MDEAEIFTETFTLSDSEMEIDDPTDDDDDVSKQRAKLLEDELDKLQRKVYILECQKLQLGFPDETMSKNIEALEQSKQFLDASIENYKRLNVAYENELRRLNRIEKAAFEELSLAVEKREDDFEYIRAALKSSHEEWKERRALHDQSINLLSSWRGVVDVKPEISWNIDDFSNQQRYEREFAVPKYGLRCTVIIKGDIPDGKPTSTMPAIELLVTFDRDGDVRRKPMIISSIRGKDDLKVEKSQVERWDVKSYEGEKCYSYDRAIRKRPFKHRCVSLIIDLWFELPRSIREIQLNDGVLFWTVENFVAILAFDGSVLYSPYFLINGVGGYRLQAVLYVAMGNVLHLKVVRRCSFVPRTDISDYVVSVTILMPNRRPNKITFSRSTDFKVGENFVLGNMRELIVDDTFLCRVKVAEVSAL